MFGHKEEEYVEVDDTKKEISEEYELDARMEYFDG